MPLGRVPGAFTDWRGKRNASRRTQVWCARGRTRDNRNASTAWRRLASVRFPSC